MPMPTAKPRHPVCPEGPVLLTGPKAWTCWIAFQINFYWWVFLRLMNQKGTEDGLFWEFNDLDRLVAVSQNPTQWFTSPQTFFWIDLFKFIFPFLELPWWWNGRHNWFKINDFLWSMEVRVLFKATKNFLKNFGSNESQIYQYAGDSLWYLPPG